MDAVEEEVSRWLERNTASELVYLGQGDKSGTVSFLFGEDEFHLEVPAEYPANMDSFFFVHTRSKPLVSWAAELNEFIMSRSSHLSVSDFLTKAVDAFRKEKKMQASKKKPSRMETESDEEAAGGDSDGANETDDEGDEGDSSPTAQQEAADSDFEDEPDEGTHDFDQESDEFTKKSLEVLRKKKRWQAKEAQLREQMRIEKEKALQQQAQNRKRAKKEETAQIFSGTAASGILQNDLLFIMDNQQSLGFSAEPVDDNIYHWNVHMFGFSPDSQVAQQLKDGIAKSFGYDYVELEVTFGMDLHPFYPPVVKVIRPRFQGFLMGRVTSMDILKLSFWDPIQPMSAVLLKIRDLIEAFVKLDVHNPLNANPKGAYSDMEHLLLRLELLSELDPRANLKYPELETAKRAVVAPRRKDDDKKEKKYWASGTGYGHGSSKKPEWDVEAHLAAQKEKDRETEAVIKSLHSALMSRTSSPESLTADFEGLEESCLVPFFEHHLKNDSLLDMSRHISLYLAILQFIRDIAAQDVLVPLLDVLPFQKQSVLQLLESLHKQVTIFLKRAGNTTAGTKDEVVLAEKFLETADCVRNAVDQYRASVASMEQDMHRKSDVSMTNQDVELLYLELMKPLQYDSISLDLTKHHYHAQLKATTTSSSSRERTLRLAQEHSSFVTSLPLSYDSSVFVRTDDDRMDFISFVITGPKDSPYESGVFAFDAFFPAAYPAQAPLVNLMTTGNGTVRFNPNLYNCGKVCLSLLGTWSGSAGESWNKDTSTFLQVLVSIQSLIMVPQPYFNEPGYEAEMGTPAGDQHNKSYNEVIRVATIEHAMVGQLRQPPRGFEDVVQQHFTLKKDSILALCDKWLQEGKDSSAHYSRLLKAVKNLRSELDKLS
eukprot:TRINITY_DN4413_c0_g1_i2.p1 TRINITY_DN4413_c0_g1~~TRINITY_DN4413_c0_g1_i2.p1  ORF type:complete len:883 (+),score=181.75 TRINITY_DN4413_c0_g1_i2:114-2762(+)